MRSGDQPKSKRRQPLQQSWVHTSAKGEIDKAIADFNEAIRLNPKHAKAYNNRGVAWNRKGEYDKAIADSNEAIKLNKTYAKAYNNRGVALSRKREYDKAIADFNQSIKLNPKDASAYFNRGNTWEAKAPTSRRWRISRNFPSFHRQIRMVRKPSPVSNKERDSEKTRHTAIRNTANICSTIGIFA